MLISFMPLIVGRFPVGFLSFSPLIQMSNFQFWLKLCSDQCRRQVFKHYKKVLFFTKYQNKQASRQQYDVLAVFLSFFSKTNWDFI